jgi:hypothetical protein
MSQEAQTFGIVSLVHSRNQGATMNSTEPPDVEGTKRKNIIEMALSFTAMIRTFAKKSKKRVVEKLEELFRSLAEVRSRDDYEACHRSFYLWFLQNIKTNAQPGGSTSYGQAAKLPDVAIKGYVYYCNQPTSEIAERIVPFLHGAIDTAILKHLKKSEHARGAITATTIKELDEGAYQALQALLAKNQAESWPENLFNFHPVQYDDILWRRLNPR